MDNDVLIWYNTAGSEGSQQKIFPGRKAMIDNFQCFRGIWALQPPKNGKKYPVDVAETSTPILNDLHGAIVLYCRSRLLLSILPDL